MSDEMSFTEWLKQVPTTYELLTAAIAAAVGLLAPERFIPQPLAAYKFVPTLTVLIAFVLTWVWRKELREHLRAVVTGTFLLFLVLLILNIRYVRPVEYQNPPQTITYLIGETIVDPTICGTDPVAIIKQCGGGFDDLAAVWGGSFMMVAISYALTYVLFITGLVLSIGGSTFGQPRAT